MLCLGNKLTNQQQEGWVVSVLATDDKGRIHLRFLRYEEAVAILRKTDADTFSSPSSDSTSN